MKILYDHQTFTLQKYGGISRYFYELIKYFNKKEDIEISISIAISNNHYIFDKKDVKHINLLPDNEFRGKQRLISLINKIYSIININKQKFDIFHPTYYDPYFLNYIGDKPFVLTVYDMIHEKFKDMFDKNDKTTQNKRILCEKALKIIAISASTKKDLIEIFGTDESKIEVVYLGNSMFPKSDININIPQKYMLFVGSRSGYKNFNKFIESIAELLIEDKDLLVVCVGGGIFKADEIELFESLHILKQIIQYNLDDDKLAYFYRNAVFFVFPSLYEGFGIPVLESFACSCPLVCSNTSSLPEIAGNGAYYFDPYSNDSIKETIQTVLNDDNLRQELMIKGMERLKNFSWGKTAKRTKKIYENILR